MRSGQRIKLVKYNVIIMISDFGFVLTVWFLFFISSQHFLECDMICFVEH